MDPHDLQTALAAFTPCLREADAANAVGLAPSTLAKLRVRGGGPPYLKLGRSVRYPQDELLIWRNARIRKSTSDETATQA